MQILNRMRKQYAVYWAPKAADRAGIAGFEDPVEVRVRWEDALGELVTPTGQPTLSKTVVYMPYAAKVGGYLWLGALEDLESAEEPTKNTGAYTITDIKTIPTLNAKQFLYMAIL